MTESRRPLPAPTPLREAPSRPPARFAAWPDDIYAAARTSSGPPSAAATPPSRTPAGRGGGGAAVPAACTIRRWAADDAWDVAADADLEQTRGRTLRQLQAGWLAALHLAQATLIDAMCGGLDRRAPWRGVCASRAAEIVLRTIERAGLLATLPDPAPPSAEERATLSVDDRLRRLGDRIQEHNERNERAGRR